MFIASFINLKAAVLAGSVDSVCLGTSTKRARGECRRRGVATQDHCCCRYQCRPGEMVSERASDRTGEHEAKLINKN